MSKLLCIEASPRVERSHSRTLAREFIAAWQQAHPGDTVAHRDLARTPPANPTEGWIAAARGFMEPDSELTRVRVRESEELVAEFLAADRYILATPMHNFHVPAVLKAYIDNIVLPRRTFAYENGAFKGLVPSERKVLIITARGGAYPAGTPQGAYDHQEPWLRTILGFIGLSKLTFVHAQGLDMGEESRAKCLTEARQKLQALASQW